MLQKIESLTDVKKPDVVKPKSLSEKIWSHTVTMPWGNAHVLEFLGESLNHHLNFRSRVKESRQFFKTKESNRTISVTWEEFGHALAEATLALKSVTVKKEDGTEVTGVQKGDHVAILGESGPESFEWAILSTAVEGMGAVCVPLGSQETPELLAHVVNDSVPVTILVQNEKLAASMINASLIKRGELPTYTFAKMLEHVPNFRDERDTSKPAHFRDEAVTEYARLQTMFTTAGATLPYEPKDPCTLIYTSGSTSLPKGAVISYGAVAFSCNALWKRGFDFGPQDLLFHDLTFSHIFGKANGLALAMYHGVKSCYGSVFTLARDMPLYEPTVVLGVPRIWDRTRVNVEQQAHHKAFADLLIPAADVSMVARTKIKVKNLVKVIKYIHTTSGSSTKKQNRLLRFWSELSGVAQAALISWALKQRAGLGLKLAKPIFQMIRKKAGYAQCRMIVSGSAAISLESSEFFERMGLPLREGYGSTETCGGIFGNTLDDFKLGSLGKPIPDVEWQIRPCPGFETDPDEGCLWVRGEFLFSGYFRNPAKTAECFDQDGWFNTKDIVRRDKDGVFWFVGRDEDMKKLDTGMWFSTSKIQTALEANDIIFAAVAIGENKPCIGALIFIDQDIAKSLAGRAPEGVEPLKYWSEHPAVLAALKAAVDKTNAQLKTGADAKDWEQVRKTIIVPVQPTPKNGLMTGSFKIKGKVVIKEFPELVTALHARPK